MSDNTCHLRVDTPCPYRLSRMTRHGENYFCSSCAKVVIDFRGKSTEEIRRVADRDTCGIFTLDQLPGQKRMPLRRQIAFYTAAAISFLGFSITPVEAQSADSTSNYQSDTSIPEGEIRDANCQSREEIKVPVKRRGFPYFFRKPKKPKPHIVMGCPRF